jgi:eukaryotic translation initiation factor 2C
MVRERLEAWAEVRRAEAKVPNPAKELPSNIIYYRDGVGTGQYETIKAKEVTAIRDAYRQLATE